LPGARAAGWSFITPGAQLLAAAGPPGGAPGLGAAPREGFL